MARRSAAKPAEDEIMTPDVEVLTDADADTPSGASDAGAELPVEGADNSEVGPSDGLSGEDEGEGASAPSQSTATAVDAGGRTLVRVAATAAVLRVGGHSLTLMQGDVAKVSAETADRGARAGTLVRL